MRKHPNKLPIVISEPGNYLTRNGKTVEISEVKHFDDDIMRFSCKGVLLTPTKSGRVKRDWNIWHQSGRLFAVNESQLDIIEKVK